MRYQGRGQPPVEAARYSGAGGAAQVSRAAIPDPVPTPISLPAGNFRAMIP
jgi:hypothetical protein